jgi:hypothetical protein
MIPEVYQLWSNAICAVIKSDRSVHQAEWIALNERLSKKDLSDFGLDKTVLLTKIQEGLKDDSLDAEQHFQIVLLIMKEFTGHLEHSFFKTLFKYCKIVALEVNQMNKSELIILSRLDQAFKKF